MPQAHSTTALKDKTNRSSDKNNFNLFLRGKLEEPMEKEGEDDFFHCESTSLLQSAASKIEEPSPTAHSGVRCQHHGN